MSVAETVHLSSCSMHSEQIVEVTLKKLDGQEITLKVPIHKTIADVKDEIYQLVGTANSVQLLLGADVLDNMTTLADCSIHEEATLTLVIESIPPSPWRNHEEAAFKYLILTLLPSLPGSRADGSVTEEAFRHFFADVTFAQMKPERKQHLAAKGISKGKLQAMGPGPFFSNYVTPYISDGVICAEALQRYILPKLMETAVSSNEPGMKHLPFLDVCEGLYGGNIALLQDDLVQE